MAEAAGSTTSDFSRMNVTRSWERPLMPASSRDVALATRPTVVKPWRVSLAMSAAWTPCARSSPTFWKDSSGYCSSPSSSSATSITAASGSAAAAAGGASFAIIVVSMLAWDEMGFCGMFWDFMRVG